MVGVAATALAATDASAGSFPNVTGRNLHGEDIAFPKQFASGKHNVVIVAFTQKQQDLVDTWLPELAKLSATNKDLKYYELPTIKKMGRIMRWVIYRGMRSGIDDAGARSRTVTLHIDKGPFKSQLGIKTEQDIFIFLTDNKGRVRWQSQGVYSKEKLAALKGKLQGAAGR